MHNELNHFYKEDELHKNSAYILSLPSDEVECRLKFKDDLIIAGLPFFFESFQYLINEKIDYSEYLQFEGKKVSKEDKFEIVFKLPFNIALSGERLALNLLQRASSVATHTARFVERSGHVQVSVRQICTSIVHWHNKNKFFVDNAVKNKGLQSD